MDQRDISELEPALVSPRSAILAVSAAALLTFVSASSASAQCPGDADNSGFVNFSDFIAVQDNFGVNCATQPYCGNGVIDEDEDCDLTALGGETCLSRGFQAGALACDANCAFDTSACFPDRFFDNGDGTITDHETGLMWERKVEMDSTTNLLNLHDADNTYRWAGTCSDNGTKRCQPDAASSVACFAGREGGSTGCDECTGDDGTCTVSAPGTTIWQWLIQLHDAEFAGHCDWRIPTVRELMTIVDFSAEASPTTYASFHGASCGASCADLTDPSCACTVASSYGTATTRQTQQNNAWSVAFNNGESGGFAKTITSYVRAVRQADPSGPNGEPCPSNGGDSLCDLCLDENCQAEVAACEANSTCPCVVECVLAGSGNVTQCQQQCGGVGGNLPATQLLGCRDTNCTPPCP